ncbi:hypothetical protein [Teichococcus vastitatis]|uniref:Uncharacterized protein n=1 Tax=Teichococcus vastitatis TaxID=2307076 RepID=A0ABS9W3R4_9PROT|nr:hypothetical protein [Pseudoroseomonas vastitatis]MCI0753510.1 hypothetical protein [Pseudoroseomonas vastitatis]
MPTLPGQPGVPAATCGPSNNSPACQALRQAAPGGSIPGVVAPRQPGLAQMAALPRPSLGDRAPQRIVPPRIQALLRDRRVDPLTRVYLLDLAGRKQEEWSVQDVQTLSTIIPVLTELNLRMGLIEELYTFLGLDPNNLFEPQLGNGWQSASTALDARRRVGRDERCLKLSAEARFDPAQVMMRELVNCGTEE